MDDLFGDRMKTFERARTEVTLDPALPFYARIDGRGFSKFTQGLRRPFDERLSHCMIETTRVLVEQTGAVAGYTQSDEISLLWKGGNEQTFFGGKVQKLCSVLAGLASSVLTREISVFKDKPFQAYADKHPHFDARVFELPDDHEAVNAIYWRFIDARKNAIQMIARHHFSHKQLQNVSTGTMLEMLTDAGVEVDGFPPKFRFGTLITRHKVVRKLTTSEWEAIPEKHRPGRDELVSRATTAKDAVDLSAMTHDDRLAKIMGA